MGFDVPSASTARATHRAVLAADPLVDAALVDSGLRHVSRLFSARLEEIWKERHDASGPVTLELTVRVSDLVGQIPEWRPLRRYPLEAWPRELAILNANVAALAEEIREGLLVQEYGDVEVSAVRAPDPGGHPLERPALVIRCTY